MKSVLILGGGIMQLPALKIAKRNKLKVYLADGKHQVPGRRYADSFQQIDLKDREGLAACALSIKKRCGLDGVFTAGTDFSASVAYVAEKCGLPGISYETALRATDKSLMRQTLSAAGIPCPAFISLSADPQDALKLLNFPMVVKPVDNMGARGIQKVETAADLVYAFTQAQNSSRAGRVIIEEFLEGAELSLDAIVYQGKIQITGVADRHIYFPPYFVEMGHTIPSSQSPALLEQACSVFKAAIRVIGIENGAAKGDIILTAQGPVIGEIAARLSGGYMSGWTYPYASGVAITEAGLKIALGEDPGEVREKWKKYAAERAFISIPGQIKRISGLKMALKSAGVQELFVRIGKGSTVVFPTNNVEKAGNVITQADEAAMAQKAAIKAIGKILVRLVPCRYETDIFLFDKAVFVAEGGALPAELREYYRGVTALGDPLQCRSYPAVYGTGATLSGVVNLSTVFKTAPDWHGMELKETWERILKLTGLASVDRAAAEGLAGGRKLVLGALFWQGLLKAGIQGGLYIVDSINRVLAKKGLEAVLIRFTGYEDV